MYFFKMDLFYNSLLCSYEKAVGVSSGISSLVSATDGNHGYGLAHVANLFNTKAKVLAAVLVLHRTIFILLHPSVLFYLSISK